MAGGKSGAEFAGREGFEGAKAGSKFGGGEAVLAVEAAEKVMRVSPTLERVAFAAGGDQIAVGVAAAFRAGDDVIETASAAIQAA